MVLGISLGMVEGGFGGSEGSLEGRNVPRFVAQS